MKRFGYPTIKGLPNPKGWSELHKAYLNHKIYLFDIKRVDLVYYKLGLGQTGARYFRYFRFPPLSYWNPDVQFVFTKIRGPPPTGCATLTIEFTDGLKKQVRLDSKWKDRKILDQLLSLVNHRDPNQVRETLAAPTIYEHEIFIRPKRAKAIEVIREKFYKDGGTITTIHPDRTQQPTPPPPSPKQSAQV